MLTVLTPASSHNLTVKETFKTEMGITGTDQDAQIDLWIAQASSAIHTYVRRKTFARETVQQTEVLSSSRNELFLDREYEISITSVTEGSTLLSGSDYELDDRTLYRLDSSGCRRCWYTGRVVIVYAAGFTLLGNLPFTIERACLDAVKSLHFSKTRDNRLRSEKVLDIIEQSWSAAPSTSDHSLPPDVEAKLTDFIDWVVV